jgi:hypothetical protein
MTTQTEQTTATPTATTGKERQLRKPSKQHNSPKQVQTRPSVLTERASTLPLQLQDSALQTQHTALHRAFALYTVRGTAPTATSANTADTRCSPHCCCSVLLIALVMAQINCTNLHTQHTTGQSQQSTSCRCPVIWQPAAAVAAAAAHCCSSPLSWLRSTAPTCTHSIQQDSPNNSQHRAGAP